MKLNVEWNRPIRLYKAKDSNFIYSLDLDKIPDTPGIYIFARLYGKGYKPIYVGKSKNLRNRVKGHLNNLKLMKHLQNAKSGKRLVIIGQLKTKAEKRIERSLKILERAFIRHFLVEGYNLVNKQGVKIQRHEIVSGGKIKKSFIPTSMYFEKGKGD